MEASQTPNPEAEGQAPAEDPSVAQGAGPAEGERDPADAQADFATTTGADPQTAPNVESQEGERLAPDSEERNPAAEQSPVATEAQDAIIGDPGVRDEQQPVTGEGGAGRADVPVRTSAPPPSAQSGVPLPEDRAAGVQPGESGGALAQPGESQPGEPTGEGGTSEGEGESAQ